ncbi:glutamine-tRNA ligase, putative / glutaminyl-tRNA synthetase, putative / GlnRS [Artemisia annua]|uniref:Glutaminyl-tRNA synthetase n=1 Tax=Artemisia annua TaxID=35608 RepID=A0A2U1L886_ARTAN|nr:glutamine-tRNA ligase, putative / glutaminyl-tRNA synthetase, putative / GlnRS [Artemisia annua]
MAKMIRMLVVDANGVRNIEQGRAAVTDGCDRSTGNLLYTVATKFPANALVHRPKLLEYIVSSKIKTPAQLEAAFSFVTVAGSDNLDINKFEEACGVGIEVSLEDIERTVDEIFEEKKSAIIEQRYRTNVGDLFAHVRKKLPWADPKIVKQLIDSKLYALLGEKTAADNEKPVKKKKEKPAKVEDKSTTKEAPEAVPSEEELNPYSIFPAPEENYKVHTEVFFSDRPVLRACNSKAILEKHLKTTGGMVLTRFPPEPNGYLHIGHTKAMFVDFGLAKDRGGGCYLRFDDTNPEAEKKEYIDHIEEIVGWMGWKPFKITYTSDYFQDLYDLAVELIRRGCAYVDHQTGDEIKEYREKKMNSPWRNRPISESLKLFNDMKEGRIDEGKATLRMKQDMQSDNALTDAPFCMDPQFTPHPHAGDKWCIYPSYDYAHCIVDSLENITHSLCTLEFETRRASYYWLLDALSLYQPYVWEYSSLNTTNTVIRGIGVTRRLSFERLEQSDRTEANIENNDKSGRALVVSDRGIAYLVNLLDGKTSSYFDTGGATYSYYRPHKANIPRQGTPKQRIEQMSRQIKSIFIGNPTVERFDQVYNVNCRIQVGKTDAVTLKITRDDWYLSGKSFEGPCALHFADISVSHPDLKCSLYCAHSAERFIRLCRDLNMRDIPGEGLWFRTINSSKRIYIDYPPQEEASKIGNILYFKGTLEGCEVFIKRAPLVVDWRKTIMVYRELSHLTSVVRLLSVEQDDHYVYMAYENTCGSIVDYMRRRLNTTISENFRAKQVLRNVVLALMQLEKNAIIHGNVCPQHVLIRKGLGNKDMIALCGFGNSKRIPVEQIAITSTAYKAQNYQLAMTILNVLKSISKSLRFATSKDWETIKTEQEILQDLKEVGHVAADLCMRLMDPKYRISLLMVYDHMLFWDADKNMEFFVDFSDELQAKKLGSVQWMAAQAFGHDWESKVDHDKKGTWLAEMEKASHHNRTKKAKAYETTSVFDLFRFFRNSINHKKKNKPTKTSVNFEKFISAEFPALMALMYSHLLNSKNYELINKYHKGI